jgi:capsid protein
VLASLNQFRRRVGAFIGGFEAGLANRRLKGFQPSRAHLNTLIAAAGPDITARARWLVRNNGYAANAIESWAGNVVGAGIKPSSLIKDPGLKARVQKLWLDWTGGRRDRASCGLPRPAPAPGRHDRPRPCRRYRAHPGVRDRARH